MNSPFHIYLTHLVNSLFFKCLYSGLYVQNILYQEILFTGKSVEISFCEFDYKITQLIRPENDSYCYTNG